MSPRFRTFPLRVSPAEARLLLHALDAIEQDLAVPESLDGLRRRLGAITDQATRITTDSQ